MFITGWAREGSLLAGLRTYLPVSKSYHLDATIFWFRAPNLATPLTGAKGCTPLDRQCFSAGRKRVSIVEGFPDLATGKTEAPLK
jgi:hypothetical protein